MKTLLEHGEPDRSKVRIGVNAAFYSPKRVGVSIFIENLVAELAKTWNLVVYTSVPEAFVGTGVDVREIPALLRKDYARLYWQSFCLPGLLKRDKVDLLFSPLPELPPGIRIPAVAVVHDLTPLIIRNSSPFYHTILFWIGLHLLGNASALATVSDYTKSVLWNRKLCRGKPVVAIRNGTNFPGVQSAEIRRREIVGAGKTVVDFSAKPGDGILRLPDVPFVLYVGGFAGHKNVPLLLTAYRELANTIPHRLVLVGWAKDWELDRLWRLVAEMDLESRVTLLRDIADAELVALYSQCAFFVYPSRYEGLGLPVAEAMACGAPVLCSNATAIPELGGDAVIYFSPDSREELVFDMRRLIADGELRRTLSEKGLIRARLFTWSRTAAAYSTLFQHVLKRGTRNNE